MSKCEYRRSSETMLHKVESCSSSACVADDQDAIQICKSVSGPIQQQSGEFSTDRALSSNSNSNSNPRTKNLYRFTLNENLLTMKVTDETNTEPQEPINNQSSPSNDPSKEESPEEEKKQSEDAASCKNESSEDICKELKGLSSHLSFTLPQSQSLLNDNNNDNNTNNNTNTNNNNNNNNTNDASSVCSTTESSTNKMFTSSDHFSLRARYPHSFNDIPNQSSFQYRLHKQWDLHTLRSNDLRAAGNRSHGDLNLKALLQREDCYLKTLRLNGDLRHKYTYSVNRPFGIWNHQSSQTVPKREHLQSLMKLMKIFNHGKNDTNPNKSNKATEMFDSETKPVGDSKGELKQLVDAKVDNLNENESRTSNNNDTIDPMDIHRLKNVCTSMSNQLNEIHTTISYVHGDLKNLIATISPTPSMCLMEEIAELREAYELTANNERKRDLQMRQIEVQLHDICNKLEKVELPKKKKLTYTYLLVPVIGCVALYTIAMLGEGKRGIPIDVMASTVVEKVVQ